LLFVILFVIHRKKANKYFRNKLKGGPNFDFILRNTSYWQRLDLASTTEKCNFKEGFASISVNRVEVMVQFHLLLNQQITSSRMDN